MPNYTTNLNLEKPLQSEQYNIDVFNANADKIDQFAGQTPARALTADKLTSGAKINGVNFKGDTDVVTGAGFYYETVTYGAGDLAFIYNQDGALELHKSLVAGNIGHNPLTSTGYWEKEDLGGSGGRNVGEIIPSALPLTDAGLHLLDGSRLSGDGIYGEFVDYIADLYAENPNANYFTTETDWQNSVSTYGSCGKFVYDSTLNTVRLPKVSDILQGTTDINALGDLVEAGLPSINHTHTITSGFEWYNFVGGGGTAMDFIRPHNQTTTYTTSNNSSVNAIYGRSNTVQPQTIKCFVYIVIATSTKTDIQVDIDQIATDISGKADTDLTNTTDSAKVMMSGLGMPSDTYVNLTLGANGSAYTAPANGYVLLSGKVTTAWDYVSISIPDGLSTSATLNTGLGTSCFLPVFKGQTFYIWYSVSTNIKFRFYYAKGSESEAS